MLERLQSQCVSAVVRHTHTYYCNIWHAARVACRDVLQRALDFVDEKADYYVPTSADVNMPAISDIPDDVFNDHGPRHTKKSRVSVIPAGDHNLSNQTPSMPAMSSLGVVTTRPASYEDVAALQRDMHLFNSKVDSLIDSISKLTHSQSLHHLPSLPARTVQSR